MEIDRTKLKEALKLVVKSQVCLNMVTITKEVKKKKSVLRKCWVQQHLLPEIRLQYGAYDTVCLYFQIKNPKEFENLLRLNVDDFNYLYDLIHPYLHKDNSRRPSISAGSRLSLTLHYLAHGDSIRTNALFFRVGISTAYEIIKETCKIISTVLLPLYVQLPDESKWKEVAADFEQMWQFPLCLGALDGKQIDIKRPPHGGSTFFNYKKFHSIVLMALSDAHSRILWFTVGDGGSFSDSSVFEESSFSKKLINNLLGIPAPTALPGTNESPEKVPYVIIADEIFPLSEHIMKPYSRKALVTDKQRIYNYRLSRARFTIECAFGILVQVWQVLQYRSALSLPTLNDIVSSCICLHNLKISRNRPQLKKIPFRKFNNANLASSGSAEKTPSMIREQFANFFLSTGAVPWQYSKIRSTNKYHTDRVSLDSAVASLAYNETEAHSKMVDFVDSFVRRDSRM